MNIDTFCVGSTSPQCGIKFDPCYTDRPYVVGHRSGYTVPNSGFKGVGDCYSVRDAWDENDNDKTPITPDAFLKLKSCFDRINRRSKTQDRSCPPHIRLKRERIRMRFNNAYMKLKQLVIRTRYRYNMRKYIITPPITQCTHHYDTALRRLCRLDNMEPRDLQKKKVFIQQERQQWNGGGGKINSDGAYNNVQKENPRVRQQTQQRSSYVTHAVLQRLWKTMNATELVNKTIKEQTQGGKSFLKQVVIPGKMLNCLYGKVLPDPTLQPDEIGLPAHIMESVFKSVNMNRIAAIVKRDPVFSSDAITTFTKVKATEFPYITLPSEIITNKQLDFDGDNVSIVLANSGKCFIETLMRLSPKITMYCYFYRTRLTFSQTNPFRISGLLKHIKERVAVSNMETTATDINQTTKDYVQHVKELFGNTFAFCHTNEYNSAASNVDSQLNETLVSLSQQYGPYVPYGFIMLVRHLSFKGYNNRRIYPVGSNAKEQALHVAVSGSKGTRDGVENMFRTTANEDAVTTETLEYAKLFIEVKSLIRKQGHNAKKMDSAFQNVIVDYDNRLTMKVNNVIYDLGHIINYIQREWVMSDLTVKCLLNDVEENEPMLVAQGKE